MQEEKTFEQFEPSNVGIKYRLHGEAMKNCTSLEVNKSFPISGEFDLSMLRKIAEGFKYVKIVVIQHSEKEFEVSRIADFLNVSDFYKNASMRPVSDDDERLEKLKLTIVDYYKMPHEIGITYDKNFLEYRNKNAISYSYLHKRLSGVNLFKKFEAGATNALKRTIEEAINLGLIKPFEDANEIFNRTAVIYEILIKE